MEDHNNERKSRTSPPGLGAFAAFSAASWEATSGEEIGIESVVDHLLVGGRRKIKSGVSHENARLAQRVCPLTISGHLTAYRYYR